MMKRYSDTLLRSSSYGAKMTLDTIHREHESALMIRNIAELSTLSGHSPRRSLRMDATRKRYRRGMRRLRVEKNRLTEELTSENKEFIELATASDQLKADVVQVIEKKKTLEEENEELKAALKIEKEKVRTFESRMDALRERNVMLDNDLYDKTLKNERLHTELNETYQKLSKWSGGEGEATCTGRRSPKCATTLDEEPCSGNDIERLLLRSVRMDPNNEEIDLDGLMHTKLKELTNDVMKKQEGDYVYRYHYNGGGASQVWLGSGRSLHTYGKIEAEEGSIGYRTLPRLQNVLFPGGLNGAIDHSRHNIFVWQVGTLITTIVEHVITPHVRLMTYGLPMVATKNGGPADIIK
ncbi:hypothetical protein Dimus_016274, partial [Dionaea muscipula]